jgi:pimeloyl-ACP methyl ester carboxylesterase
MMLTLKSAAAAVASAALTLAVAAAAQAAPDTVRYRTQEVEGVKIFYREAGAPDAPTIVLLHGFPTSSHMYRNLIPALSARFHVIAPDYPGFGQSDAPTPEAYAYSFDHLASTMDAFLGAVGARHYVLYLQDYGGPVGLRIAAAHPERVDGLVIQNANAYLDGFSADAGAPLKDLWEKGRSPAADAPARVLFSPDGVKFQYQHGARDPLKLSPDAWTLDDALLARPGNDEIQLSLLADYKSNLPLYPAWQAYLRQHRPRTLVAWGKNDPIFAAPGALAYRRDVPEARIELLDTGHFALEEEGATIARLILETFPTKAPR